MFECMDSDWCSYLTPAEDYIGDVWRPVLGEAAKVEKTESTSVEALPWWVYAYSPEMWALTPKTVFQVDGQVFRCGQHPTISCEEMLAGCLDPATYDLDYTEFETRVVVPEVDSADAAFEIMRD